MKISKEKRLMTNMKWETNEDNKKNLSPIVLFTYNRLNHTQQTMEALKKNIYACESYLYIYSDAAKNEDEKVKVNAVRQYLKSITGFKKIEIIERKENWGLARNIIDGVTKVVNKYGKIIVLEDDLVTSKYFLKYMNDALEIYKDEEKVMQISGYSYPMEKKNLPETFFIELGESWGWATWKDSWSFFERNPEKLVNTYSRKEITNFNYEGTINFWNQVMDNYFGKKYTWAVFFHAAIKKKNGLVFMPRKSLVNNVGFDGTGENCERVTVYNTEIYEAEVKEFSQEIKQLDLVKNNLKKYFLRCYSIREKLLYFCKNKKKIVCYGAGEYGCLVAEFLKIHGIFIDAFIVSSRGSEKKILDVPVIAVDDSLFTMQDYGVVLSLDDKYHEEVMNLLKRIPKTHIFIGGNKLGNDVRQYMYEYCDVKK